MGKKNKGKAVFYYSLLRKKVRIDLDADALKCYSKVVKSGYPPAKGTSVTGVKLKRARNIAVLLRSLGVTTYVSGPQRARDILTESKE